MTATVDELDTTPETANASDDARRTTPMATAIANPHLHELPDSREAAQIAKERKAEARKHMDAITKAAAMESVSSLKIGWHAAHLKREGLFGMLGFETEDEARRAAGVGRSTWYSCIRLAESFSGLDADQFTSMKLANAQALSDMPESKRLSREWIRMAGSMSIEDFAAKVDEEMHGKARASDTKETARVLKMPVPASRFESVNHHLEECAKQMGVDPEDKGKVVELLAVERTGQTGLIQVITGAVQVIKEARKLKKSNLSAEEMVEKLYSYMDDMALSFKAALDGVQNLDGKNKPN